MLNDSALAAVTVGELPADKAFAQVIGFDDSVR